MQGQFKLTTMGGIVTKCAVVNVTILGRSSIYTLGDTCMGKVDYTQVVRLRILYLC